MEQGSDITSLYWAVVSITRFICKSSFTRFLYWEEQSLPVSLGKWIIFSFSSYDMYMVDTQKFYSRKKKTLREQSKRWTIGIALQLTCIWSWHSRFSMLPLQRSAVACVSTVQGNGSNFWWMRSLSSSCDNRNMNIHSDKEVLWLERAWRLSDSNLSLHEFNQ